MARLLSQTLTLAQTQSQAHKTLTLTPNACSLLLRRDKSSQSGSKKGDLFELELGPSEPDANSEIGSGMRRIEEALHGVIVRKSAPDWLPFMPGASYWVPPFRKPLGVVDLFSKIASERGEMVVMTEEESLSFTSRRGWPSSTYFVDGGPPHPVKEKMRNIASQTDDEES
ncbi:hypothetical protein LUZ60_008941 [Juncus effusus]|nr:hypothetical protein LUZ60_008941 [Juncus effusus]